MEPKAEITVCLPIALQQSKKKRFLLNLNVYRNAHFLVLNKMKIKFKESIKKQIDRLPFMDQVEITYTIYPSTAHLFDVSNIGSVVDKFFCDALVEAGKLEDDNYLHLIKVSYQFGSIDRENPRAEATMSFATKEEENMRITIVQVEIETAIKEYIERQISIKEGQEISIDFKATRGEDGATADINIGPAKSDQPEKVEPKVTTRTRQAAVVPATPVTEPEVQVQEVAETVTETPVLEQPSEPVDEVQTEADAPVEASLTVEDAQPTRPAGSLFAGLNRPKND